MLLVSFKVTAAAILEIFLLGLLGSMLVRKKLLGSEGLDNLSRLVMEITLPLFIFSRFIKGFSFTGFPHWWRYPLLSIGMCILGFFIALPFIFSAKNGAEKRQFCSLVAFQNSGYLPIPLIAALLPAGEAEEAYIYLFLFLAGFNLLIWSVGPYMLSDQKTARFEFTKLFSSPVVATLLGISAVLSGINHFIPGFIYNAMKITGDCTLPLALFVVGGSLAEIKLKEKLNLKAIFFVVMAKLIIMPLVVLLFLLNLKVGYLAGLLLLIQAAMPPATSLSIILRQGKNNDFLVNPAILIAHLVSIVSVPLFLTIYFFMVK